MRLWPTRYYLLLLLLLPSACGSATTADRPPTPDPAATRPRATARPTLPAATAATANETAIAPADGARVTWEGVSIPLPPHHRWVTEDATSATLHGAPVLAQGRIVFDRAAASPDRVELPDGVGLTIVQFSGSPEEWLDLVQTSAPAQNPVDPATISATEVAGQPALAYSHMVTGVGDRRTYVLKIRPDRLLIIDDTGYPAVIEGLALTGP